MEYMLPFVKDIQRLKLKMFGNTTFVSSKISNETTKWLLFLHQKDFISQLNQQRKLYLDSQNKVSRFYFISSRLYFLLECFQIPLELLPNF